MLASVTLAQQVPEGHELRRRVDHQSGLVYYEDWYEEHFNGVVKVESLDSYLTHLTQRTLTSSWQENVQQAQLSEDLAFDRNGLIPEINLPKLPLFGEGSKIDVAGSDRITLGGQQTTITGLPGTGVAPSWLPELKMEQALKINLNGSIGDKTKVFLDHDSERQLESKNKIRLSYEGSEDEIIQSIEAGDTRLAIPATGYTGDLPSHKGLFGISARGKLGGIDLYSVAAREQSETQTQEFRYRNQSQVDTIYDTDYLPGTIFRLDTVPRNIKRLEVWIDDGTKLETQSCVATVYPDRPSDSTSYHGDRFGGDFRQKLLNTDYVVWPGNEYVELTGQNLYGNYTVGVSYTYTYNNGHDTAAVGGYLWRGDSLVLKLIKPQRPDTLSRTWDLEVRDVYSIGARDIKLDTIRLIRQKAGEDPRETDENGINFLRLVGLDPDGDGRVTWPQVDVRNGYLICPRLQPFASESLTFPDSFYRLPTPSTYTDRKYYFVVNYSTAKESYNLGQTDLEENSEKVYINGSQWTRDVDYKVSYTTGELTFQRAMPPDADIRITFEYRPLFSLAQKSVLGARAEWKFLNNGKLGSSIFYRTEEIPGDKPSLGNEPFQRMVAETDFGYDVSSDFVTSLLDHLPLVRADAPATFHIGGEGAISMPDPNTRGAAYLDDFEGSTMSRDIGIGYRLWQYSSVPVGRAIGEFALNRLVWFNPLTRIAKESIFGSDIGEEGRDQVEYLRVLFQPDNLTSWAGIMNCPSGLGMNVADLENVEAVLRTRHPQGRIHVTVATRIDEDAPRRRADGTVAGLNGHEDTEDNNGNGILDETEGEDAGLDGIAGPDDQFPSIAGDDGNDDFDAKNIYANPNGTEGNKHLDREDLTGLGWTTDNDYYEYTFSLTDTMVVKNLSTGWKSLRVSLRDSSHRTTVGSPRLEDVMVVRVWFDSFSEFDTIDIYSLAIVGSRWRNPTVVKPDTLSDPEEKVRVSLISKKTDPDYEPPFEPRKDQFGRTELEASLKLSYENLKPGHRGIVRKNTLEHDDYRDYRGLRVYVHTDATNPDFFLQIGADSINYYEVRQTINAAQPVAGRPDWYEIRVPLDTFPLIKYQLGLNRDSIVRLEGFTLAGNPSLADVRYMALGIENTGSLPLTGTIWVDDIRIVNPRKDPGFGFNTSLNLKLSDLASFSLGYRYEDPNFRRFSEGRGVKTGGYGNSIGYGIGVALDRLFPASWGLSLPFNYQRNSAATIPKFASSYPDLLLPDELREKETGSNSSQSWDISARKNRSSSKLMNYTLEALSYSFRRSTGSSRTLLDVGNSSSNYHSLACGINPDLKFKIGETDISYFPQSIRLSGQLSDNRSPSSHRMSDTSDWIVVRNDSSAAAGYEYGGDYSPVSDLSFNYSVSADRDRTDENYWNAINIGQESGRDGSFGASYNLDIGEILSPKLDFDGTYSEDRLRLGAHYEDRRNVQNAGDIDLTTDFNLPQVLSALGKLRDEGQDKGATPGSPQWVFMQLEKSEDVLSGIDLSYSYTRSSNYTDINNAPPFGYQLGFNDQFPYDSTHPPSTINREVATEFSASTDFRLKSLDTRLRYSRSWNREITGLSPTGNLSTSWPDISLTLSRVEGIAPKLLSSSSFSSGFQQRNDFVGVYAQDTDTFELVNRRLTTSSAYSPLLSWQANWKNKINTAFSTNYTKSRSLTYFEADRATSNQSENRSYSLTLGYSFSAPQGIRFPGLKKVRFSSDLDVSLGLTYGSSLASVTGLDGETVISENNRDWGTSLSFSYRFSRSIEGGLNSGYNAHRNVQRDVNTGTTDLNFWILFKF